ncbi:MAG: MATE family efflux transporter [Eubacterium sp.]|nr:MATE family efflux transporter [Eubacterium sp.]MCM1215709.1 MATE family efflux transporter [Lachnospiraceae bacterium]MCM1238273.1 MATE family efflux transporter [Lachnospiraceae bacterium]MCM1305475.1 MATE family efflux transporter [Butyrivibrio sp.]MCM1343649.1 MATE family efflux transporter [Muribaculaceae bacterium]
MAKTGSASLSEKDRKFREFALTGNLWRVIFYVCVPLAFFQFINHLFNILDTMMASHVSALAVSAVAYLSQLQSMISAVGGGLAAGSTLKISEAYGAGDYQMVKKRLSTLLTICGAISLAVLCLIPFSSGLLRLFGTPEDFIAVGARYFSVTLFSTVLSFFNNVYIAIERSRGNSRRILKLNMLVVTLKLILTAIFIYGLNGDITMIAVATVVSQAFLFVMAIKNLCAGDDAFTFDRTSIAFKRQVVGPMLNLSFPVIVEKVAFSFGKTVVNSMSKNYGSTTVGALGISNNINGMVTGIHNGFQDGGSSIISQNLGAGNTKRALGTFWRLAAINAAIGAVGLIILNVFLGPITWLFANSTEGFNEEFQQLIMHVFRYEALGGCIPLGINAACMALLFGFGKTKLTLVCNFSRVFVFRIPILWALQNFTRLGSESVGIVMAASNMLTAMLSFTIVMLVIHKVKKAESAERTESAESEEQVTSE